jgi:hypothetical protein
MALHEPIHHPSKTLAEGAVCFACAILGLMAIAFVVQWLMDFIG